MNSMAWFLFGVGGVAAVIYWMMTRLGTQRPARRSGYDGSGADSNFGSLGSSSSGVGWSFSSWFGGDGSSSHDSGSSSDSGGGFSGGGDSGGGGDGGGGGGD